VRVHMCVVLVCARLMSVLCIASVRACLNVCVRLCEKVCLPSASLPTVDFVKEYAKNLQRYQNQQGRPCVQQQS